MRTELREDLDRRLALIEERLRGSGAPPGAGRRRTASIEVIHPGVGGGLWHGGVVEPKRDFEMEFEGFRCAGPWNTSEPAVAVHAGVIGWMEGYDAIPTLANVGESVGKVVSGDLDLVWSMAIPRSGTWALQPGGPGKTVLIEGSHKVSGKGLFDITFDARVEAEVWMIVALGAQWLFSQCTTVCSDATKNDERPGTFTQFLSSPGGVLFRAERDQELDVIIRLHGYTWANNEGAAELCVRKFGVLANTLDDLIYRVCD